MLKTEDTQLTIYSLKHKKHGEVSTCIQSYSPGFNTDSIVSKLRLNGGNHTIVRKTKDVSRGGCPAGYSSSEESLSKL